LCSIYTRQYYDRRWRHRAVTDILVETRRRTAIAVDRIAVVTLLGRACTIRLARYLVLAEVNDTVTAHRESTVLHARAIDVVVLGSVVALLRWLHDAIAAARL
jgi:hypothetical protein